jgi:seryl-tRNA synthetase
MPELALTPQIPIPDFLIKEIQSKLAYVDEVVCGATIASTGDSITLMLRHPIDTPTQQAITDKVQRVVEAMAKNARRLRTQILEDYLDRPIPYHADPMQDLLQRGEVFQEADGLFTLGPILTNLIDYFESIFLDLAAKFNAKPYRFPTLIPARFLDRVNYFRAFPHSLSFATHLREDLDVIEEFSQHTHCDCDGALTTPTDSFARIQTLLSPAVCYHLYFSLADQPLAGGKLAATAVGSCFRYESSNLVSLERLWNFTMREIIFVGPQSYVLEQREAARQYMQTRLAETGLAYRVESANDPFFIGEFRQQAIFQSAFELKYEIRARLPFRNATLAVGSYNYHQDFFGRNLNITLPDGSPTHTGCVAFGLERIALAFLAQFGLDQQQWPQAVRQALA